MVGPTEGAHRTADICETVASVLLAIGAAHLLGAAHANWAAFAGYMVLRASSRETIERGTLRIAGTAVGGGAAAVLAPYLLVEPLLQASILFVIGALCLYRAMASSRAYAWLFIGLTFAMIVFDAQASPHQPSSQLALTRLTETFAGTGACVLVSVLSAASLRRRWPTAVNIRPEPHSLRPGLVPHALIGGLALALLSLLASLGYAPGATQASVAILAVMLGAPNGTAPAGRAEVARRMLLRLVGCASGCIYSALLIFVAHGTASGLLAGAATGAAIGRTIETASDPRYRYLGTQFALVVLVAAVPDDFAAATLGPALDRLVGSLFGILLLTGLLAARERLTISSRYTLHR